MRALSSFVTVSRPGRVLLLLAIPIFASAASAQTPPPGTPGTVTLPLVEYDKLIERASRPAPPAERPPVPAVVARADMLVHATPSDVHGTITLQGEVLQDGRVKVPLVSGATLIEAQQGTAPVAVVTESGLTSAILSGPGPFTLTVSFGVEVVTEPGRASAPLPAVRAGTVRATIDVPGDSADVRVDRGLAGARSSSGGKTSVDVTLEPGVASRLSWSSREAVRAPKEARVVSDVKTLVTVAESDLRLASLFDISVLQGQPGRIDLQIPDGFEIVSVSGGSVETAGQQGSRVALAARDLSRRRYQFLVTLERTVPGGLQHTELAMPAVEGTQRETGEIAWEAMGTVDLTAPEAGPLRRMDVTEVNSALASLARSPLLAAFRYQRRGDERVPVAFDVRRFADAPVLGAVASDCVVTTLVSSEGRALTEFDLTVRNRGQLFLKVGLPKGATLLSAEVGGVSVKPVDAPDGARVPLVRSGFQPVGPYRVSFVYVEAGTTFDRKGEAEMKLPRVDLPITLMWWEVFLPERFKVRRFEGNAMAADLVQRVAPVSVGLASVASEEQERAEAVMARMGDLRPDQVGGVVVDTTGAVIPGATVTIVRGSYRQAATSAADGSFLFTAVPPGRVDVTVSLSGFKSFSSTLPSGGRTLRATLEVGSLQETVNVQAQTDVVQSQRQANLAQQAAAPSQNVTNLQRRISGVLPVRIDIPRTGQSFTFVRPLVLDEETALRFQYKAQ